MADGIDAKPSVACSRRSAVHLGGALVAGLGGMSLSRVTAAQSTPSAASGERGVLLVQSFSHGSLFPTQGEAGVLPYTLILWGAADRGFFFVSSQDGTAGFAPTNSLLIAIAAGARPDAAVVMPAADESAPMRVWALRLAYGGLGSDPDAVTYQGEAVDAAEISAWLGVAPEALARGVQDLEAGFLVIAGPPALDIPERPGPSIDVA